MTYLIVAMAAALSFFFNRALFRRIGYRTILVCSPILEEVLKTLPAYLAGVNVLTIHFLFGAIEGAYEWHSGGRAGRLPAALSVIGHSLFGLATVTVLTLSGSLPLALMGGCLLHMLWNLAVVKFF